MNKLAAAALTAFVFAGLAGPATAGSSVAWKTGYRTSITVKKGQKVKFVWADSQPHNMYGAASAGAIRGRGKSVTKSFRRSGTIRCSYHPNMWVKVNVR
ncbi:MAG: hypothetical protein WCO96_06235 [Actinomycetes bacterium]